MIANSREGLNLKANLQAVVVCSVNLCICKLMITLWLLFI